MPAVTIEVEELETGAVLRKVGPFADPESDAAVDALAESYAWMERQRLRRVPRADRLALRVREIDMPEGRRRA